MQQQIRTTRRAASCSGRRGRIGRHRRAGAGAVHPVHAQWTLSRSGSADPRPVVRVKYRIYSSPRTGGLACAGPKARCIPGEGGQAGHVLVSDIPNNRIMKFDEDRQILDLQNLANYANGNARDRQGRLITCEHSVTRRVVCTEKNKLKVTISGRRLRGQTPQRAQRRGGEIPTTACGSPIPCSASRRMEGFPRQSEQATTNVYRVSKDGKGHGGDHRPPLNFNWRFRPTSKRTWSMARHLTAASGPTTSGADGSVSNKTKLIDAADQARSTAFASTATATWWCGWGSNGALQSEPTDVNSARFISCVASRRTWMA